MTRGLFGAALAGAVLACTHWALAEPATTAWLRDVSVQEPQTTQTVLAFEHQLTDIKARGEGIDYLRARIDAGIETNLSIAPELSFRQRGEEPLRLQEVALRARWLALDQHDWPRLMLYGGYANDLSYERDHLLQLGLAAAYDVGALYLNADLRPTLNLGGDHERALESWSGLAVGYGWGDSWQGRAGLEMFFVMPLIGARLSDPTFGEGAESNTYYYGPSVAFAMEPFWTSASAATGYFVSTAGSQFMLSWLVGVAY